VTEPQSRKALVAEQNGHAPPSAGAGDDYLDVITHSRDEGQALPGGCLWPIGSPDAPALAEKALNAGPLSLQLRVTRMV